MAFNDDLDKAVTDCETQVTATEGVEASAALLINNFGTAILAAKGDVTKINAIVARYKASADALGAAVAANPA